MSAAVSVEVLAEGAPIDRGGMADGLAGCYGAVPAVGIAAAAVLGAAALAVATRRSLVFFVQVLNALMGIPATTDPIGPQVGLGLMPARTRSRRPGRRTGHLAGGDPALRPPRRHGDRLRRVQPGGTSMPSRPSPATTTSWCMVSATGSSARASSGRTVPAIPRTTPTRRRSLEAIRSPSTHNCGGPVRLAS